MSRLGFLCRILPFQRESSKQARASWRMMSLGTKARSILKVYYADVYRLELPSGHRFPGHKYALVREILERRLASAPFDDMELSVSPLVAREDLELVHSSHYISKVLNNDLTEEELRKIGFPWTIRGIQRTLASCGGTVQATLDVLEGKFPVAGQLAGGTHHAYADRGEGFCFFNDLAVAARVALRDFSISRILVLDLDVHQGNGTARIFQDEPRVTTFSMHGEKNYPLRKEKSDYDVELPDECQDEEMLSHLRTWLPVLLERHRPELVLFQAGVDPLVDDSLGRLSISREGLMRRNNMVFDALVSAKIPSVITMGGGYSRPIDASVEAHADVFIAAAERVSNFDS